MLAKVLSVEGMVRPDSVRGPLPRSGEAYGTLLRIAGPSVVEMVFVALIGFVDTVMVGSLGYEAIAAVGLTGQPRMLMLAMFFALNIGVTAIVARRKGQELPGEAGETLRNALVVILALSLVIMVVAVAWSRQLMLFAGANEDTLGMAETYFTVTAWFLPVNAITMCINAAQRGIGNTKTTMYVNVAANVVNVIGNYLLINGNLGFPKMGVAGAALATGIGMCVGLAMCLIAVYRGRATNRYLSMSPRDDWRLKSRTLKAIVKVGGNAMMEQVGLRFGFFLYAVIVASLGTESFAAHQVAMQFLNISFCFGDGIGVAGTSLVGQSLGMERPDLATVYCKCSQRVALLVSIVLAACILLFRTPLIGVFIDGGVAGNEVPFRLGVEIMLLVAMFQPVQMSSVVISGCLRGAGDNLIVAVIMIVCVAGIRPTLCLISIRLLGFGLSAAWTSSLIDMSIRLTLVYRRLVGGRWQNKKV
ncbi:MAG: MATE family efflux transporter [Oscillospiraceae bacterium]|nr:MATE family efflux transporter [Oscillospiraceae bacterium]